MTADDEIRRGATFSLDGEYRYRLTRRWGEGPVSVTWVMLNPSTADANVDDPTIRRCIGFTKAWGGNALTVVNLFAYRATNPKALHGVHDPIGPLNWRHVAEAVRQSTVTVCAWGAHAQSVPAFRYAPNVPVVAGAVVDTWCLGTTKNGSPRHPLYVRADTPLSPYPPEGVDR